MTSPISKNSTPLSSIFDLWQPGTDKAPATGIKENGVDTSDIYAMLKYGSAAAPTGVKSKNADLNTIYAAKGSASYALPVNGRLYTRSRGRGGATLAFNMLSNGTYSIVDDRGVTLDSGSWLPAGDAVASYSCKFSQSGFTNGPDISGGTDTYTNGAPSVSALTTSRSFTAGAAATTINTNASNGGTVTMQLYKSGVLRSTTSVSFQLDAAGT